MWRRVDVSSPRRRAHRRGAAVEVQGRSGIATAGVRGRTGDHRRPGMGRAQLASKPVLAFPADRDGAAGSLYRGVRAVSYTHLRAHETRHDLVCRLLLEKKKKTTTRP